MPKIESEELTKVTLLLFKSDYERLIELAPRMGVSAAIRLLVRQHVARLSGHAISLDSVE